MRHVKKSNDIKDDIAIAVDTGLQADISGGITEVDVKRNCKLIKPTLWDYQRETELLNNLKDGEQ